MTKDKLYNRIIDLEREIALLPEGSITKKRIKGKEYYYHRISHNGKRTEKFVSFDNLPALISGIEKRKALEEELCAYKAAEYFDRFELREEKNNSFNTIVRYGDRLIAQVEAVKDFRQRECIKELRSYIYGGQCDKVFILFGLRRTGKTTMIRQIIEEMPKDMFAVSAFIQVTAKDSIDSVNSDLRLLEERGFKYIFIDEVTLMEDFVEDASIFADIFAASGMKIVLSGTDSLGFAFSREEQLYDRCIMLHTTFIPYREFEDVLGIKGIDEYIRYGGTMSISGTDYNSGTPFSTSKNAKEYIDTAIAKNIQHSLKMYKYGGHFRSLNDLYEKGELTNVINRVVENINHSFTKNVIEKTFESHDLAVTASNLLKDREEQFSLIEHIEIEKLTFGIRQMLDILNIEEQSIDIKDYHMQQIREYLKLLDLIVDIDIESLPQTGQNQTITVISQPGLRFAQATAIVENMLLDVKFSKLSIIEKKRILDRILSEIEGRMMEEIVLLETKIANPSKRVFKLQFAIGEYDMVVFDPIASKCKIFEIKHSRERVPEQYRHLKDKEKCDMTTHSFGEIEGRYVLYRGDNASMDGIQYLNVEEYLKGL